MPLITQLYGLETCDTCRKARNWLQRAGIRHEFIDYRERRIPSDTLAAWAEQLGGWERLINRNSTTWRSLPEARRAPGSVPEWTLLIKEYPAVVKRPVLVSVDGVVSVGFTEKSFKLRFGVG